MVFELEQVDGSLNTPWRILAIPFEAGRGMSDETCG